MITAQTSQCCGCVEGWGLLWPKRMGLPSNQPVARHFATLRVLPVPPFGEHVLHPKQLRHSFNMFQWDSLRKARVSMAFPASAHPMENPQQDQVVQHPNI